MSAQLLSSKLIVQEEPPTFANVRGVPTGVTACVGLAERGPVSQPTLLTSYEDFVRTFGAEIDGSYSAVAVRAFFENGGERMYFTRTVHYSGGVKTSSPGSLDLLTAASATPLPAQVSTTFKAPFAVLPMSSITIAGTVSGTVGMVGHPAAMRNTAPFDPLVDNDTLVVEVNGVAQLVTFRASSFVNLAAPTPSEVAEVFRAQLSGINATLTLVTTATPNYTAVQLETRRSGTSASLKITGGTAAAKMKYTLNSAAAGTGIAADMSAMTGAELKARIEAVVPGVLVTTTTGGYVKIATTATGPTATLTLGGNVEQFGLDTNTHVGSSGAALPTLKVRALWDGTYSTRIKIQIKAASNSMPDAFDLAVVYDGTVVESFANLTMDRTSDDYAINRINGQSSHITVSDLYASTGPGAQDQARPANNPYNTPFGPLAGGSSGLDYLTSQDFTGVQAYRTGFYSFDLVADVELLICPEVADPVVVSYAINYVKTTRNGEMFAIIDPPEGLTATGIQQYALDNLANRSEYAAAYWPRVKVLNPNTAVFGPSPTILVPPCGHIAGMFARNDGATLGGVYQPPGGVERGQLYGVLGFETDEVLDERVRDLVTPAGINPITRLRGQPIAVNDVMTLLPTGAFPTVSERRGVIFIERSIKEALEFCRLRNHDDSLRRLVKRTITAFLLKQMRLGAFRTQDPATAFFVDCSTAINPPSEVFAGKINVRVGLATQKPARFVILSFSQDTRALDQELASAAG